MKRWNLKSDLELLASFNHFGVHFYDQPNYIKRIAEVLNLNVENLEDMNEGIYHIQEELGSRSIEIPGRQKGLFKQMESEIYMYLMNWDIYNQGKYRIKRKCGFVKLNKYYCPVLFDIRDEIDLKSVRFLTWNLEGLASRDFWDIPSTYSRPGKLKKSFWEENYLVFEPVEKIIL